jgi:hypothetical protein
VERRGDHTQLLTLPHKQVTVRTYGKYGTITVASFFAIVKCFPPKLPTTCLSMRLAKCSDKDASSFAAYYSISQLVFEPKPHPE